MAGGFSQGLVCCVVLTRSAPVVEKIVSYHRHTVLTWKYLFIYLLIDLRSWRKVGSQQREVWMPRDLSASSARLEWEEMALAANKWAELLDKGVQQNCKPQTNDIQGSLYLITQLLPFLLSVPGAVRHLLLNLLFLPQPLFLLRFRFIDQTLVFQPMQLKAKKTVSELQARCEEPRSAARRREWSSVLHQRDELLTLTFSCLLCSSSYPRCIRALWSANLFSSFSSSALIRSLSSSCLRLFSSICW